MLQSLAFLCCSATVFSSQLAEGCAFSWLCPAGCTQRPRGHWLTFLSHPASGQGTVSQNREFWSWEWGYNDCEEVIIWAEGLADSHTPEQSAGFRVRSVHPKLEL